MTLPKRVKERPYERDDQRREAIPLVAREGRLVVKKLNARVYGVRKIIEFQKPKGRDPAQVEVRWEAVAAPLVGLSSGGSWRPPPGPTGCKMRG